MKIQDTPPAGGYPEIPVKRNLPIRGLSGFAVAMLCIGVSAYGFYMVGLTNRERREEKREKAQARISLVPFLQAEEDRRFLRVVGESEKEEARIMKGVPNWEVGKSVYETKGNWVPPVYTIKA